MHRFGPAIIFMLAACSRTEKPAPAAAPDGWQCFTRDPGEPDRPDGNVTHLRQRVIEGRIESDSVFVQGGSGGATRLVLKPVGDHLEATLRGQTVTARLLVADGSHWTLSYRDTGKGLVFDEDSVVTDGVLTVTSIDAQQKTAVRFVPTSCDVVVAELAKYPP
ncbi:MAG: hypothetical protein IPQ07_20165 [Myxococcales bacterium]|nr:hypothetical protein [Myxococcales bacterium]